MYEAKVNGDFEFKVATQGGLKLNGQSVDADVHRINDHTFQVLYGGGSYTVHVVGSDSAAQSVKLRINGKVAEVKLTTELDRLLKRLGMENLAGTKVANLKAPMPGLIHSVMVEVGTTVAKGEPLLILEAMKMENVIKSPTNGTIKKIHVNQGESVEKGKVMVDFG
ncbi:MAG: acetyl-CoA carboxylase biotin carboxyl carrier protein subunit [Bacteroidota bacterium]